MLNLARLISVARGGFQQKTCQIHMFLTMISILPNEGWFSYFTNESARYPSFQSWSTIAVLCQKECLSLWNI